MKIKFVFAFCILCSAIVSAQVNEDKKSVFQLTFISPLGTNGMNAYQYTNLVSFNVLIGISKNEEAFTFGGLTNTISNNATGFQFAGLVNYVGQKGKGLQFAGLVNMNKSNFIGLQFGGLANTASNMKGVQFGGFVNIAKDVHRLQFGGLANIASNAKGVQFGGFVNIAKDVHGLQFGGLANIASNMKGVQFGGFVNIAKDVHGLQFGGLVNIAKKVKGVQFAGLVNVAESSDCPIGIINIIKHGEKAIGITYEPMGSIMLSFRSGGKYTYGIIGLGYNYNMRNNWLASEAGLGVHIPILPWFRINNEIKFSSIGSNSDKSVFNNGYSLIPAFKIGKHLELFAGASINYMQAYNTDNYNSFHNLLLWKKNNTTKLEQVYIGYIFGVQCIF